MATTKTYREHTKEDMSRLARRFKKASAKMTMFQQVEGEGGTPADPEAYAQGKVELGDWDEEDKKKFLNEVQSTDLQDMPDEDRQEVEEFHRNLLKRQEAEELVEKEPQSFVEAASTPFQTPDKPAVAENDLVRDIGEGLFQAKKEVQSMAARAGEATGLVPEGGEMANELLEESDVRRYAAALEDKNSVIPHKLHKAVRGATRTLAETVPAGIIGTAAGGPVGGVAAMSGMAGGAESTRAIKEAEDAGLKGSDKWQHVGTAAGLETGMTLAFSAAGLGGLEKVLSGGGRQAMRSGIRNATKNIAKNMGHELTEEELTEISQRINEKISGVNEDALTPESLKQTVTDTALQTILATGGASSVRTALNQKTIKNQEQAAQVLADQNNISEDQAIQALSSAQEAREKAQSRAKERAKEAQQEAKEGQKQQTYNRIYEQELNKEYEQALGKELEKRQVLNPEAAEQWVMARPAAAIELKDMDTPSRRDFKRLGLPDMNKEDRQQAAKNISEAVANIEQQDTLPESGQQSLTTRGVLQEREQEGPPPVSEMSWREVRQEARQRGLKSGAKSRTQTRREIQTERDRETQQRQQRQQEVEQRQEQRLERIKNADSETEINRILEQEEADFGTTVGRLAVRQAANKRINEIARQQEQEVAPEEETAEGETEAGQQSPAETQAQAGPASEARQEAEGQQSPVSTAPEQQGERQKLLRRAAQEGWSAEDFQDIFGTSANEVPIQQLRESFETESEQEVAGEQVAEEETTEATREEETTQEQEEETGQQEQAQEAQPQEGQAVEFKKDSPYSGTATLTGNTRTEKTVKGQRNIKWEVIDDTGRKMFVSPQEFTQTETTQETQQQQETQEEEQQPTTEERKSVDEMTWDEVKAEAKERGIKIKGKRENTRRQIREARQREGIEEESASQERQEKRPTNVDWFVNYTTNPGSGRTTETKRFDRLKDAREFAKGWQGYITKVADYGEGVGTGETEGTFIEYFGGFQPSAQEGRSIEQVTGEPPPPAPQQRQDQEEETAEQEGETATEEQQTTEETARAEEGMTDEETQLYEEASQSQERAIEQAREDFNTTGRIEVYRDDGTLEIAVTKSAKDKNKIQLTRFDEEGKPFSDSEAPATQEGLTNLIQENAPIWRKYMRPDIPVAEGAFLGQKPKNAKFQYRLRNRPVDKGTIPREDEAEIVDENTVQYDNVLTQEEINRFELEPVGYTREGQQQPTTTQQQEQEQITPQQAGELVRKKAHPYNISYNPGLSRGTWMNKNGKKLSTTDVREQTDLSAEEIAQIEQAGQRRMEEDAPEVTKEDASEAVENAPKPPDWVSQGDYTTVQRTIDGRKRIFIANADALQADGVLEVVRGRWWEPILRETTGAQRDSLTEAQQRDIKSQYTKQPTTQQQAGQQAAEQPSADDIPLVREPNSDNSGYRFYEEIWKEKPGVAIVRSWRTWNQNNPRNDSTYEYQLWEYEDGRWQQRDEVGNTKSKVQNVFDNEYEGDVTTHKLTKPYELTPPQQTGQDQVQQAAEQIDEATGATHIPDNNNTATTKAEVQKVRDYLLQQIDELLAPMQQGAEWMQDLYANRSNIQEARKRFKNISDFPLEDIVGEENFTTDEQGRIVFEVPKDGTFKLQATLGNIFEFRNKVKNNFMATRPRTGPIGLGQFLQRKPKKEISVPNDYQQAQRLRDMVAGNLQEAQKEGAVETEEDVEALQMQLDAIDNQIAFLQNQAEIAEDGEDYAHRVAEASLNNILERHGEGDFNVGRRAEYDELPAEAKEEYDEIVADRTSEYRQLRKQKRQQPSASSDMGFPAEVSESMTDEQASQNVDYAQEQAEQGNGKPADKLAEQTTKAKKPIQARDVIDFIRKQWQIPVRGKATFKKRALGWYRPEYGEIRMQDIRNVTVAIHELGHHFDRQMEFWSQRKTLPTGVKEELVKLGKDLYGETKPARGYKTEGFAEFIRDYLTTNGDRIRRDAPTLYKWFTREYLQNNPKQAKKINKLQARMTALQTRNSQEVVRAFRQPLKRDWSPGRMASQMKNWLDEKWRDVSFPLSKGMEEAGIDESDLAPENNPRTVYTAHAMSASGKAHHATLKETTDMAGDRTGESLRDALHPVSKQGKKTLQNFWDYMVARRALTLHERGIEPGISQKAAQNIVDQFDNKTFRDAAQRVSDWSRRELYLLVETGAMTQADFDTIVEMNPVYVPFFRQFEKGELSAEQREGGGNLVYKIKGSGREIHDPAQALIWQAERITQTAMQADFLRSLVTVHDKYVKTGEADRTMLANFISEVAAPQEGTQFTAEKVKKQIAEIAKQRFNVDDQTVQQAMLDQWDELMTVFTQAGQYKGKENIVGITIDGQKRFFQVDENIYKMLTQMNQQKALGGAVGAAARQATQLQRLGATGLNAAFSIVRNPARDIITGSINFDYAKGGPLAAFGGIVEDIVGSELEAKYHALGVDLSGWIGQDKRSLRAMTRKAQAGTIGQQAMATATTPIHFARTLLSTSEAGPRLAEFRAAYKYGLNKGMSRKSAALNAAVAGKDVTINFTRSGEYGRQMNEAFLFFNAAVQGYDKFGRTWRKAPGRTALRVGSFITLLSIWQYERNKDKEWWKNLPAHEKWLYNHFELPNGVKIRIPMPFEYGLAFGTLPIALLEDQRNPGAFQEALNQSAQMSTPEMLPSILVPAVQAWRNTDWKGDPIVPEYLEMARVKEKQYTSRTDDISIALADMVSDATEGKLAFSPAKFEHLVDGYSGGLYNRVLRQMEDIKDPSQYKGGPHTYPAVGTLFLRPSTDKTTGEFYDRIQQLQRKQGSDLASLQEMGELAVKQDLKNQLSDKFDKVQDIKEDDSLNSYQRNQKITSIYEDAAEKIRKHDEKYSEKERKQLYRERGAGKLLTQATHPSAGAEDKKEAVRMLKDDMDKQELRRQLYKAARSRGWNTRVYTNDGKLTAFGERLRRLNNLFSED